MVETVVITGVGTVGPAGSGLDALRLALRQGRQRITPVDRSAGFHRPGRAAFAGQLGEDPYSPWLSVREARRMSPASRMAVCAARMAIEAASLEAGDLAGPGTAVCLGTGFGSTTYASGLLQQVHDQGPLSISPLLFMETVANAHAGQVALALGSTGSNVTLSQREASGLLAMARAADLLRLEKAERVLAGCVDEVSPILHAMLDRFGALVRPGADQDIETARVFDVDRSGFVISEGGTVCVMESLSRARERGAVPIACVRASARAMDPTAPSADWGSGPSELARRLRRRLVQQGVDVDSIDVIVSGANGSRRGDRLEALALREAFDDRVPPVLAPKSVTGEYGGGFLASALLALQRIDWKATPGFRNPDPDLGLTPYMGEGLPLARRVLVTSLAAGGAACWLILDKVGTE